MKHHLLLAAAVAITLLACNNPSSNNTTAKTDTMKTAPEAAPAPLRERVLTAEEQKALTPDMVITSLKEGNKRFMANNITSRDHSAMVRNAAAGQFPKAVIL